jgi:hypothetical protein
MIGVKHFMLFFTCFLLFVSSSNNTIANNNGNNGEKKGKKTFILPKNDVKHGLEVNAADSTILWKFKTLKYWADGCQNATLSETSKIINSQLNFYTHKGTVERPKVRTKDNKYTYGEYTWRVYIPMPGKGDRASVGAFLYFDDHHEVDFEIGYGPTEKRKELNATDNDIVLYMTSQDLPYKSEQCLLTPNKWYTLSMKLTNVNNKYKVTWFVDGVQKMELQTTYGCEIPFHIYCSLENLNFIGDHITTQDNTCIFDYVKYRYAAIP